MNNREERIRLLQKAYDLEDSANLRNALWSIMARIRMPMSEILERVPGPSASARAQAIGISRQTYYSWLSEEVRPTGPEAERLAKASGLPLKLVSAREMEDDDDARRTPDAPTAVVAGAGSETPHGRGGVPAAGESPPRRSRRSSPSRAGGGRVRKMRRRTGGGPVSEERSP